MVLLGNSVALALFYIVYSWMPAAQVGCMLACFLTALGMGNSVGQMADVLRAYMAFLFREVGHYSARARFCTVLVLAFHLVLFSACYAT